MLDTSVQAGPPRLTAHQLRQTLWTETATAGVTATELQAFLGHEDSATGQ